MLQQSPSLSLEFLEPRVLLSAVDVPSLDLSEADIKDAVLHTADPAVHAHLAPNGETLFVSGGNYNSISIDLSLLPVGVVNLNISSFDSVALLGQGEVDTLTVEGVGFLNAGQVAISDRGMLVAIGAKHIEIDQAPKEIVLEPSRDAGATESATLLEVGQFSSLPNARIDTSVRTLGLATTSHVATVPYIHSLSPNPTILLNFQPDNPVISNIPDLEVSYVKGDHFDQYFYASPEDRAALEHSLLFTREPVRAEYIPLAVIEMALATPPTHRAEQFDSRILEEANSPRSGNLFKDATGSGDAVSTGAKVDQVEHGDMLQLTAARTRYESSPASHIRLSLESVAMLRQATVELNLSAAHASDRFGEALHATIAQLSEPLSHLISGFREQLTTFSALVSAHVTDHLRIEYQYPLLVDARPMRVSSDKEVLIVTV